MLLRFRCWRLSKRFPGYKPQPVTTATLMRWLKPFSRKEKSALLKLLDTILYLTEEQTREILLKQNEALLRRLNQSGIKPSDVIYVQVHDAGSSSPVMLNMLKDYAHLERLGCHLVDSKNAIDLQKLFGKLEAGAVIYVDDFAGTGNQFCSVRDTLSPLIPTTFVEFVIMPAICEEAHGKFAMRGIEAYAGYIHSKSERPLRETSSLLDTESRLLLNTLCARMVPPVGLGYEGLASNTVLYRNAPNTIPAVLRGSRQQVPYPGVFPRSDDFPPVALGPPGSLTQKARDSLFKTKDEAARTSQAEQPASTQQKAEEKPAKESGENPETF